MSKRIGLAIMRMHPLHNGHEIIINRMREECDVAIVGIGSCQKSREINNPFTYDERRDLIRTVYGDSVKIVPLNDLGTSTDTNEWCDYVLKKIKKIGLDEPTDYYAGSVADAIWYRNRFFNTTVGSEIRLSKGDFINNFVGENGFRLLHIENRNNNNIISATEIRTFLYNNFDDWKKYVNPLIHDKVVEYYNNFLNCQ